MGIGSLGDLHVGFRFWRAGSAITMLKCKSPQTLKQTLCPERFEIGLGRSEQSRRKCARTTMGLGSLGKSPWDSMAVELGPPDFETSAQTLAKTLWGLPVA